MSNDGEKIARLEEKYNNLDKEVAEVKDVVVKIKDNHLVHLAQQITDLDKKMTYFIGGGTAIIGAIELLAKFVK